MLKNGMVVWDDSGVFSRLFIEDEVVMYILETVVFCENCAVF